MFTVDNLTKKRISMFALLLTRFEVMPYKIPICKRYSDPRYNFSDDDEINISKFIEVRILRI